MIGDVAAIIMVAGLAAEPWVPSRATVLEVEKFTTLRGTEALADEGATGGETVVLAEQDAEAAVRFLAVAGTYVCALRCKARSSGANSVFVLLDGERLRPLFAPVKEWGEPEFEFRIDEAGEHVLSFVLRERPGFLVDWLRVEVCPVLKLKPLYVETDIAVAGQPAAAIVASESIAESLIAKVVEGVRSKTGVGLPVRRPGAEDRSTSLIAIGGVNDSELIRRLWGWGYTRCGPKRPGPGGYVVETVHDPFGTGKNVIVLGGTGEAGFRQAAERFCELVPEGPNARIEHVVEVVEKKRSFLVAPKPEFIEYEKGRMATWLRTGGERRLAKTAIGYGAVYYQNGHAEWAELFKHGLYRLQEHMVKRNKLGLGFRDAWLYRLIRTWDLVEEMPHVTDGDRLRITNYILDLVRDCRKVGYFRKMKPGRLRWNHETVPALGMLWAGEYFWKYYRLPEAKEWSELARTCFEPQLQAFKPLEDAQGYQWGTLAQVLTYTHASGDYTYYRSNSHRRACELAHMTIDNLGYATSFGDHPAQPNASHVPAMAGWADWFYDDPRFSWVAGELSQGTVEPREPVDLLGAVPFPLHREVYRLVEQGKVRTPSPPTSSFERTFDKISFRSNCGKRHQYLLLDGYSRGHHLHYDGNAIIRFTDRGRIWLHDSDYIRAMPKYHNSVTIARDGQSMHIPPVCGLDLIADFTKVGLTRTSVRDYNGMDWLRNVLWAKDELLLVIDDLVAKQPAHYALQCYWRTLGDAKIDGRRLETVQTERPLVSKVSLSDASGEAAMRYDAQDAHLVFDVELKGGEHELQVRAYGPNTAADSLHIDLDGKRALTLGIGVGKFSTTSGTFNVKKTGRHQIRVYLRESPGAQLDWIRLTPADGEGTTIEAESASPPAPQPPKHFFITDLAGCRLKLKNDEETGRKYWRWYPYAEPVVRILHQVASVRLEAGEKHRFISLLQTRESADDPPFAGKRVTESAVLVSREPSQGFVLAGVDGLEEGNRGLHTDATSYVISPTQVALGLARSLDANGHRWLSASEPIHLELDLDAGTGVAYVAEGVEIILDVPGVGAVHVGESSAGRHVFSFPARPQRAIQDLSQCLGGLSNALPWEKRGSRGLATKQDGLAERWSADAGSPVLCLAAADLDGDGADDIVAGTHGGTIRAFSSKGAPLWQFATGGQVRSVAACDLEGDGQPEIVAGSDDCNVYALSSDGRKLWAFACPRYRREGRVVTVFPADLDGDGKHEVIAGAENWHYFALDQQGRELWRFESVHGSTVGTAADLDADGKQEVVMGTEYYWWRVVRPNGKLMFGVSHGPHCTAVWAGDLDGDGKGEAVFGCADSKLYLHVPEKRHHTVWAQSLGEEVTDLLAIPGPTEGQKTLVAGAESFNVFGVDPTGGIAWRRPFGDVPRCLCKGDFNRDGWIEIGVGCEDGSVSLLSSDGSAVAGAATGGSPADIVTLNARGRAPWLATGTDRGRIQAFSVKQPR